MKTKKKTKIALRLAKIKWKTREVPISKVTPTEKNYKIKTDIGRARLQQSLKLYGLAGAVVTNAPDPKGNYSLVDGNSRREDAIEAGEKTLAVSYPSRKLTPKEFKEMSAMFDYAVAGDIDMKSIEADLGKTSDFYKRWNMEVPMELLKNMGKNVKTEEFAFPGKKNGKVSEQESTDIQMVNLFFSVAQEKWFRSMEDKHARKINAESTTEFVLKSLKKLYR